MCSCPPQTSHHEVSRRSRGVNVEEMVTKIVMQMKVYSFARKTTCFLMSSFWLSCLLIFKIPNEYVK